MAFSPSLPQGPGSADERQQLSESEQFGKVSLNFFPIISKIVLFPLFSIILLIILIYSCFYLYRYPIVQYVI